MIKCNFGTVSIEGIKSVIKAELSTLILALIQDDVLTVEEVQECVDSALNTTPQELENISDELTDKLKKILEILEG